MSESRWALRINEGKITGGLTSRAAPNPGILDLR